MTTSLYKSVVDEQIDEVEFAGKTRAIALRLARRQGFTGDPARYGWVAPGIWLLRFRAAPSPRRQQ